MSQELGTVVSEGEDLNFKQYPIGSLLKIIPYHVSTYCGNYSQER